MAITAHFAPPRLSLRLVAVWRRNFLVWKKLALPSIIERKGTIVAISSIAGYRGLPGRSGYSASKFAVNGFMESLRTELLDEGVNVMWISPGYTSSNIRNAALNSKAQSQGESPINETELMSSEACAGYIINAIVKRKRTLVLTFKAKQAVSVNLYDKRGRVIKTFPPATYPVGPNVVGEVAAGGPNIMKGYVSGDERQLGKIDSKGRLRTGDLGRIDEDAERQDRQRAEADLHDLDGGVDHHMRYEALIAPDFLEQMLEAAKKIGVKDDAGNEDKPDDAS